MAIADQEVLAFIAATEAAYGPGAAASVAEARTRYDAMVAAFRAPRPAGLGVEDVDPGVPLRVYGGGAGPALLYLHGGGFVLGGLDSHDDVCAEIAADAGVPVVAVGYRLAPEHRHPAQLDDAARAWRYLCGRFGSGVVAGDSAGGTLAAGLCLRLRRQGAPLPLGQVLVYPALGDDFSAGSYVEHADAPLLRTADMAAYRAARFGDSPPAAPIDEAIPLAAPSFAGLPPAVVVTADVDPVRDDGLAYAAALEAAGVPARAVNAAQLPHGFLRARHRSGRAADAFATVVAAVRASARGAA